MIKNHLWKIVALLVVLALGASVLYSQKVNEKANEGVVINSHVRGNQDSSVKLVEYSDFQCPACSQAYPFVEEAVAEFGDQISFEYKHFPLITIHKFAVPAARAAEAADQQGKFWEMYSKLFEDQSVWSNSQNPETYFIQYASDLGLDVDQFKSQMNSSVITDAVTASFSEARDLGLTGTPTFFLNGEKMTLNTFDDFRTQIESAIEASKQ